MKVKTEYKDRKVSYTTAMGVKVTTTLGEATKAQLSYLKRLGYNFDGLVEEPKPRKKKYEGINEDKKEDGE